MRSSVNIEPEGLNHLPAFVRGQIGEDPQHPVRCLLEAFEANLHLVERMIEKSSMLFDPEEIPLFSTKVSASTLLQYLASWIFLDLDQEWLTARANEVPGLHPGRAAAAMQAAPALYRRRGTPTGLTDWLRELHGWEVEIVERSWPRGMEIETSSTIGHDTWLMEELDEAGQFTVLLKATEQNLTRLGLGGLANVSGRLTFELAGQAQGRRIEALLFAGSTQESVRPVPATAGASGSDAAVVRLHKLLDREKPAHTYYYLALDVSAPPPPRAELPQLVIESTSIIEHFWLT